MSTLTGGCFCGSIRFEMQGPEKFACFCYCNSCQHAAGAPVVPWATYSKANFRITQGEMRWHASSPGVTRGLCAKCGSSISYENDKRPGEIDITLNTHDDPDVPTLRAHIYTEDKPSWMKIGDDLPVFAQNAQG